MREHCANSSLESFGRGRRGNASNIRDNNPDPMPSAGAIPLTAATPRGRVLPSKVKTGCRQLHAHTIETRTLRERVVVNQSALCKRVVSDRTPRGIFGAHCAKGFVAPTRSRAGLKLCLSLSMDAARPTPDGVTPDDGPAECAEDMPPLMSGILRNLADATDPEVVAQEQGSFIRRQPHGGALPLVESGQGDYMVAAAPVRRKKGRPSARPQTP